MRRTDAAPPAAVPYAGVASPAAPSARVSAPASTRLLWVDWLRLIALAGVFAIHVAEVFNPWDEWHITSPRRSRLVGEAVVLMAPWIMPLFMLLAGVAAWYSLERRTNRAFVRERLTRLLVPLVVGVLVLVPPQVWLERRLEGRFRGSLIAFYPHFFDGLYPRGNFSWHHLWFLGHLLAYSLIALPLFRHLQTETGRRRLSWVATRCGGPAGLLWLALPLILERQLLWGLFPERHMLTSDWSNHALLFVAFVYGFALAGEPALGRAIDTQWPDALAAALTGTALLVLATWREVVPSRLPPAYEPAYLAFWTLYAIVAWAWMVAMVGMGRRWLTRPRPALDYARQTGYAWYLLHQPIIVAVAFVVVQWRTTIGIALLVLVVASAALTLAGGELLRRTPGLGPLLGADRRRRQAGRPVDAPAV